MNLLEAFETQVIKYLGNSDNEISRANLVMGSVAATVFFVIGARAYRDRDEITDSLKKGVFAYIKKIPSIRNQIETQLAEIKHTMEEEKRSTEKGLRSHTHIPEKGLNSEEAFKNVIEAMSMGGYDWKEGKVSGGIFSGKDDSYSNLLSRMYKKFQWDNPLHADVFPGVRKMEAEIVRMTCDMFHGDENSCGTFTAGGSESLLLMIKAYRDYGRSRGITRPEIIASNTFHASLQKGCKIFGCKSILIKPNVRTYVLTAKDVSRKISANTILIAASAPDFPYGAIDNIEEIAELSKSKDIPLHVDCCLGGFILPFMDEAGFPVPHFDFRVPGVTSISADIHKYGCSPKGASVIMYKEKKYLHHQYMVVPDWPGGIYGTASFPGSRAGYNSAMAWTAMIHHGRNGYVEQARKIISVARYIKMKVSTMSDLFIYGDPIGPVVAIGSNELNIYQISDHMVKAGWHLQPIHKPRGLQMFLTSLHAEPGVAEKMMSDLKTAVDVVKKLPRIEAEEGLAKMYGMAESIPDKGIIEDVAKLYMHMSAQA